MKSSSRSTVYHILSFLYSIIFMRNILKRLLVVFFSLFIIVPSLRAGTATVDLNVTLNIQESAVETTQPFTNLISISNLNSSGGNLSAAGANITYTFPSGTSYNSYTGTGWICTHDSSTATCTYNNDLFNGQTSNILSLLINAPSTITTVTPSVSVSLVGNSDPNLTNNTTSDSVLTGKSNLAASKSASKSPLELNEPFTYTINVSNPDKGTTTLPARNVSLSDTLPTNITFVSFNSIPTGWSCSQALGIITCSGLTLAVNDNKSLIINVQAPSISNGLNIVNTAHITTDSSDYNTMPLDKSATVVVQSPDLTITQSLLNGIDANNAAVGSNVIYNLHVTNIGASPAINVGLINTIPIGSTLVGTSGNWTCSGTSTINCTLNDNNLTQNEAYDLNITVTMPSTHGDVTNSATVSTITAENNTANNTSSLLTHVRGADLNIDKTPDLGGTDIGTNYTYTITVSNAGLAVASNVVVTDTLDSSMTYVSDTGGCTKSGQILTCNRGSMPASSNSSFTVTVKMPTNSLSDVTNTASVATSTDQENLLNISDTATTHIIGPNLNITKDANVTDVGLGKPFSYTINVINVNTAAAKDANITDQLPSGVQITSIPNPNGWTCPTSFPITGTFHCTKATFAGGATSSITFEALAPTGTTGSIQNIATISHSLNANDGTDTANVNVTGVILTINKVASTTAVAGGLIDYNITVTNTSLSDAGNLTLSDNLSTSLGTGYTVNSVVNPDGWTCGGTSTLTCTRPSLLAKGASSTIHFKVNVPFNATLGTVTNTAQVTTTTLPTPIVSSSANTVVEGADIVVVPPTTTTAIANTNVIFSLKVRNDGSATAKDVNITNFFNTSNIANFTNILIDCNGGTNYTTGSPYTCQLGDIAKNAFKTITISATAPNYDSQFPGNSNILNTSTAVTSTSQSNTANDTTNWSTQIHGADLVIFKTPNTSQVAIGGTVTYTITVKNQWEANATNIQVTDNTLGTAPDKFTFISNPTHNSDWTCTVQTNAKFTCNYNPAVLSYNQTTSPITIQAQAPNVLSAIDNARDNQAVVTTDTAEKETATTNTDIASVIVRGADLNISKTVSPNPSKLNESVTYTITVANNGLADASNAFVNDTLPSGFTNISTVGCGAGSSIVGNSVHCTLGTLAQYASKFFTITANAPNTNGNFLNTATTSSSTLEKNLADNNASVNLQVQGADLAIHKAAPARVAGNSQYNYTISLQNIGYSPAYGAEINDTIPTNVTYVNGSLTTLNAAWTCSKSGSNIHCNTNDSNLSIPVGYNQNIVSFRVQAGPAHYWVYNTATTATNTSESNYGNNTYTAATEVIDVDLAARKLINGVNYGANENYININGNITYTLQVENDSLVDINITDVNVTDLIPANVSNVSVTPNARFTCNNPTLPGETLFCTMNNGLTIPLQRSEGWISVATITVNAIDAANFDISNENNNFAINRYKAQTSLSDQDLDNNAPTTGDFYLHTNTLVRGANMSITKTVSSNPVGADQPFSYNLAVRNWPRNSAGGHDNPSTTADNIVVKDILPTNVNFISATGTNWSCSENSHIVTCSYGNTIAPSNSAPNITVNVTAPNSTGEVLTNEANVTNSTKELTRLLPDNTDAANTTTQGTDIEITKTGPATAGMSDVITYSVTVTNSSPVPASNIFVLDTFPNGATYDGNISNVHWSLGTDVNGSKKFLFDQNLSANSSTNFTFTSTLPHYTGIARNHVEAFTSTAETSSPNKADWDTNIIGADIIFASNPTQTPNPVGAYGSHHYNITIKNEGLSPAKDINVTFNFNNMSSNPGWMDVNGTGTNWNCDAYDTINSKLICHLPTLSSSSNSNVLTISSIAPNYDGNIINSVSVIGIDDTNATTGQSKNVTTTIRGSDLKITKYAKDSDPLSDGLYHDNNITVGVGKTIDFKFSVSNQNLGLAKDITVTDILPIGFSDLNITNPGDWSCLFSANTLTCNRASLAPNTSAPDILISAKTPSSIGTATNTADINTSTKEVDNTNNTSNIQIKLKGATLNVDLNASKTQVAMNEVFTYILNINNTGGNDGIDINTTDILPADFTYVDSNGSDTGWNCNQTSNTITCKQPIIPAYGGNSILKLNVQAPFNKIGTYPNSIGINSNSIATPITTYAPDVRVIGADIVANINAATTDVLEDRNITYTINVKDINISTANNVYFKQTFSHTVNALYITNNGGADCNLTDANQSVQCSIPSLAYNKDKNITVVATMPFTNTLISPLTSTVSASTASAEENTINNTASTDVTVYPIKPDVQYHFEECIWNGTSGEVKDSIGTLNATAKNGAKTLNHYLAYDSNNFSTAWRSGSFDGSDDYISIPNNNLINTSPHEKRSISLWFDSKQVSSANQVIYQEGGRTNGLAIYMRNSRIYVGGWNRSTNWDSGTYLNTATTINKWHHVVLTLDTKKNDPNTQANTFKAYLDGVLFGSGYGSQLSSHSGAISIGNVEDRTRLDNSTSNGQYFKGYIDEVEIYNIALDSRAVKNIYDFEKAEKNYDGTARPETICGVDLSVVKSSLPSGNVGAESALSYAITITNLSDEPLTKGFTLTDNLPADTNYTSETHSTNLSCVGTNNFNCTFPNTLVMKKNDSETVTVNVKTANKDKVTVTNTATVTPVQPDSVPSNNSDSATNQIIGTDLKITKTATPSSPNAGVPFFYTVKIENISPYANARDIVMKDHFDSRLTGGNSISIGTNETNSSISCSLPNASNVITCDISKLSMGNFAEFNITMTSANVATALINEANVTSATVDTDLTNNHTSLSIDTNSSVSGADINELHEKYFNKDVSVNRYGKIATIGNTILVAPGISSNTKLSDVNSTYANSLGGSYINSSSATLNIIDTNNSNPDDNVTIEYAGLFWGGHIHGSDKNDTGNNVPFNVIKFITPDGLVHTISADKNDTNPSSTAANRIGYYHFKKGDENNTTSNIGNYRIFYGGKADITSIISGLNKNNLLNGGTFSVADMNITKGQDTADWAPTVGSSWERYRNYGYFGGWSMVVVYSINHRYHREVKFKNLSSFSGFRVMTPKSPGSTINLPIPIDGFITPIHGDIESSLSTFVQGGDRELPLDLMTVENMVNIPHAVIEDLNNTTNIFNDTITVKNIAGNIVTKSPNVTYNVGTDLDQYNLNSNYDTNGTCINNDGRPCYLSNSQQQTKVTISVSQSATLSGTEYPSEQAFAQMMSMETQIFAPDFIDSYKECFKLKEPLNAAAGWVSCSNPLPQLRRGDTVKYRITVLNTGDDYADDVYVTDKLPKEVTYEHNSTIATNLYPFSTLETNSPCSDPNYNSSQTIRDECIAHLKYIVDGNETNSTHVLPNGDNNTTDLINHSYNGTTYGDVNNTLVFKLGSAINQFPRNNVAWIEFNTTINSFANLGKTFSNSVSIQFTNPTLAAFGYGDSTITQVSLPVESSPVYFNWDNIVVIAKDINRNTVGTKIVNEPFDLNISLGGISSLDADANTSIFLNSLRIIDAYNGTTTDIYPSVVDANVGIPLSNLNNIHWLTHNTTYNKASRELGFDMNISIVSADNNHTESKKYPDDFNASAPYAGDVFTTRPKSFSISLNGALVSGLYNIVNAGATNLGMNINAPDFDGNSSQDYDASLSQGSEISIGLDNNFSTNPACININDLNISDINFTDGTASAPSVKYNEVGVIKIILKDSNWTYKDSIANDCNTTSTNDNNSSDGLVSCSIDGNSTSIVFKPDHFEFSGTTVNNYDNNFTYMVENPISDPMYANISTSVTAKNAEGNTTVFFSNTCFANDVNVALTYNAQSKNLSDLNISTANDNNLTNIFSNSDINATANNAITIANDSNFSAGIAPLTIRMAIDRNQTVPLQPASIDPQDLNGSINSYLGITNADVSDANGTDINATSNLNFYYGRVHSPDYRFAGDSGTALVYYEVYCKDCTQTDRLSYDISGGESVDSINWYINTLHSNLKDGNVSVYKSIKNVKFGSTTYAAASNETNSTAVANGVESIIVAAPSLPYIDKVEMNATNWVTFTPIDFLLEFQDEGKDWAGQGKLGHIIDTNVSIRSNRRLNW